MAKFIEVLQDGLTVERKVCRAGQRLQVTSAFDIKSKKAQAKRWGAPRYREITKADYEGVGGVVVAEEEVVEAPEVAEAPEPVEVAPESEFEALEGLNVQDTLEAVSGFSDEQTEAFIRFEKEGQNRSSVLNALGFVQE